MEDPLAISYQPAADDTFLPIPKSYLEENYIIHIAKDAKAIPGNDIAVYAHPNGITLITLAPSHAAFREDPTTPNQPVSKIITGLAFDWGSKSLINAEFKKGRGPVVHPGQALCKFTVQEAHADTATGQEARETVTGSGADAASIDNSNGAIEYVVTSPVRGALVEINKQLIDGLAGEALRGVLRNEYIAILDLKPAELEKLKLEGEA